MSEFHQDEENLKWQEVSREQIVDNQWMDLRQLAYKLPDGRVFEPFYSYSRRDYAIVVAIDIEGKLLAVRQFRHGIGEVTTEFPAGGIETDSLSGYSRSHKDPAYLALALAAAKRELKEETGYISEDWAHLITVPSNPSIADNYAFIFVADNCRKVDDLQLDDTEFLNVVRLSKEELWQLIAEGGFQQAIHIMAFALLDR